jgi:phage-related protein
MQERIKYINHQNEVLDFGRNGLLVSASDLHDYNWTVTTKNNKLSSFRKEVTTKTLPVVILCKTPEEGVAARNRLMEVAEKDVLAKRPGRLVIGDYYYVCYITGSTKAQYLRTRRQMEAKLTIMSDRPFWVKESQWVFTRSATGDQYGEHLDYPMDYAFDFSTSKPKQLVNQSFTVSNFRMNLFGPGANPVVYIAGHAYGVNCSLEAGEYATIDSAAKTVTKTAVDGTVTNIYNLRRREPYVFEPIPPGGSAVAWDGAAGVNITLLEERSEPKWT